MRVPFASVVVVALLFHAATSSAQPARDPALAEELFKSAQACLAANDWQCACPKFSASMDADPSVSTQINVAKCLEHDGKLTLAWAALQDAIKLNRTIAYPDETRRAKLGEYAQKTLDALEKRVPKIRIVVAGHPEGLAVQRDGSALPIAALGEPIRVDPGEHEIVAEAPGYAKERRVMKLSEGQVEEVSITLTKAVAGAPANPSITPSGAPAEGTPAPDAGAAGPVSSTQKIAGWSVFGVGIAGLGAGGILGIVTLSKSHAADSSDACLHPTNDTNITACNSQRDAARGFQTGGIAAAVVGGLVAAAGVVIVATAPRAGAATKGIAAPRWSLHAGPVGVTVLARY
jgi:hypothetical protein